MVDEYAAGLALGGLSLGGKDVTMGGDEGEGSKSGGDWTTSFFHECLVTVRDGVGVGKGTQRRSMIRWNLTTAFLHR